MATWQYGELMAESVSSADDTGWVTHTTLTWRGPGGAPRAVEGTVVHGLNQLGLHGWELSGVTRTHLEDKFQIKVVTTYTLKRPVRRRMRAGDPLDAVPVPA
ncbi:MAG TPA: hypothetical protein VGF84_16575 [Micromonosporaceae bacterium]|jgi:hypothetical protein